ncbi:response regulator [Eisenbergiella tayi]|uniref:response regulator n=1 Tax=Eisenbergiella tayi TaxID=1432052 RepID=UPI0004B6E45D|nr:response regulator [Eisenbergiella tayi]
MYRLLIVDDEPMIVEGLKAYILTADYSFSAVDTASNGREALEQMEKQPPDMLITDIRMPQLDGIGLLSAVREREWGTKVIVLSGYNDFEYVRSMAVLGIENYLLKPVNEEELYATVSATLKKLDNEQALQMKEQLNADLIRENIINRWLYGSIGENELIERAEFLDFTLEAACYQPCIIRLLGTNADKDPALLRRFQELCRQILSRNSSCYYARNYAGDIIAVYCPDETDSPEDSFSILLNQCLETVKNELPVSPYVLLGSCVENYWEVSASFREAIRGGIHLDSIAAGEAAAAKKEESNASSPFSLRLAQYVLEHYDQDLS